MAAQIQAGSLPAKSVQQLKQGPIRVRGQGSEVKGRGKQKQQQWQCEASIKSRTPR